VNERRIMIRILETDGWVSIIDEQRPCHIEIASNIEFLGRTGGSNP